MKTAEHAEAELRVFDDGDSPDSRVDELAEFFQEKAAEIWPAGSTVYCPRCHRARHAKVAELATFLDYRIGMATCCGHAMHIGGPPATNLGNTDGAA